MSDVTFESATYPREEYESVLDCLLRNNKHVPYACKAGMCQACMIKAVDCEAPETANKWVRKSLRDKGYALACQWVPDADVEVELPRVEEFSVAATITAIEPLNARVMRVLLKENEAGSMFHYAPGQYLTLINPEGIARSYSIANDYERDGHVELHIGQTPRGLFSGWIFDGARPGDLVHMRGPAGDCCYTNLEEAEDCPIVLAGTGTGLAPLYGIVRDALARGHKGPISLFHGAPVTAGLYYVDELLGLQEAHDNFHYHPCVLDAGGVAPLPGQMDGAMQDVVPAAIDSGSLGQTRVFLCGNPDFVHGLRKRVFLKGVKSSHIYCDPFLERNVAGATK